MKKIAFTMAGGGQAATIFGGIARRNAEPSHNALSPLAKFAFTMAEILLSLTIIGVVAAITLPSLMGNINERTWNTQRKALHARMAQAIAMMPQLDGYGKNTFVYEERENGKGEYLADENAAEAFLTEGLSKVLKINNICDNEHLADCGIASSYTDLKSVSKAVPTDNSFLTYDESGNVSIYKAAAMETQNGESLIAFYNPNCKGDQNWDYDTMFDYICAYFVYDLNGNKGPNALGKDMGAIAAIYATDPMVVAPMPLSSVAGTSTFENASSLCTAQDPDSRLMNKHELAAYLYSINFWGLVDDDDAIPLNYWSSSRVGEYIYVGTIQYNKDGGTYGNQANPTSSAVVQCIKR